MMMMINKMALFRMGTRVSMMLSALTYTLYMSQVQYQFANDEENGEKLRCLDKLVRFPPMFTLTHPQLLYLNNYSIYVASALLGLGGPIIWTAQGTFLANNSKPETITRHPVTVISKFSTTLFYNWFCSTAKILNNIVTYCFSTSFTARSQELCNLLGNVHVLPPHRQPPVLLHVPGGGVHHIRNEEHPRGHPNCCLRAWHRPHVWPQTAAQPKSRRGLS